MEKRGSLIYRLACAVCLKSVLRSGEVCLRVRVKECSLVLIALRCQSMVETVPGLGADKLADVLK